LEGRIEDKQIKIFNTTGNQQRVKQILQNIDEEEAKRMKEMNLTEEKLEIA
jgi:hypothetical protein